MLKLTVKSGKISTSAIFEIRHAWRSVSRDAPASPHSTEGITQRRTELLSVVPPYLLPALLGELNREDATRAMSKHPIAQLGTPERKAYAAL